MRNKTAYHWAFPSAIAKCDHNEYSDPGNGVTGGGLNKREYFAAMAMQAMIANPVQWEAACKRVAGEDSPLLAIQVGVARFSIEAADALIVELDRAEGRT